MSSTHSSSRPGRSRILGASLAIGALSALALGSVAHAQSPSAAAMESPAAAGEAYTVTAVTTDLGTFLTGEDGKTLYYFTKDAAPGASVCEDDCATNWPPFTLDAGETLAAGDGVTGVLATFSRSDGTTQVAYDGRPLYYFAPDAAGGDVNGQGIGDVWFVALVDGSVPAPAASGAPAGAVTTVDSTTTDLGTFLTDADGKTLYYFTKDAAPGASVCTDGCLDNWPALAVAADGSVAAGEGVTGVLGAFVRADGTMQATYDGRPLYYFIGDAVAGDVTGQGIGDVWFVALVDGSVPAAPAASTAP